MQINLLQIAFAAFTVFAASAAASGCTIKGRSQCPQQCGAGQDNLCYLPPGYCKCQPYALR
ncbi:Ammonium transporter [Venturia inaequalis]|nr:Ammonium transporter [Venturia inaequalis]